MGKCLLRGCVCSGRRGLSSPTACRFYVRAGDVWCVGDNAECEMLGFIVRGVLGRLTLQNRTFMIHDTAYAYYL